jgi:hypothetical protein
VKNNEIQGKDEREVKRSEKEGKMAVDQGKIAALVKSRIEMGLREVRRNYRSRGFKKDDPSPCTTARVSSKTLKVLRKFYDNKQTSFKSPEQAKAL